MTTLISRTQQNTFWKSVVRVGRDISVSSLTGSLPVPGPGQALVRIVAASICGADMRIARGDKDAHAQSQAAVAMGHEGCGIIEAIGEGCSSLVHVGDFVVVLPHIHVEASRAAGCSRSTSRIEAACTSRHHTEHAGWDFPGVFSDFGIFPLENLVPVSEPHLARAEQLAPELDLFLFTITEPMLCCLSAYDLMEREVRALSGRDLGVGRALVVGCGPIGAMHGIILSERGFELSFTDPVPARMQFARRCLGGGSLFDPTVDPGAFEIVVVTANVKAAVELAEAAVKDGGLIYLFAGMNAADRQAAHPDGIFQYETLHRLAQGVLTWTGGKRVLYLGHSGYSARLAAQAVATVSANAARLDRLVTGVIPHWDSPTIRSRGNGVADWTTGDGSPAILSVLSGQADLRQHGKLIVVPHLEG
jgi:threonine dehydrogenase-like Zn-dependent dehydrogenase